MKTVICLLGKTNTGKDTIASYIGKKYGINAVCSYTTRPKRDYEVDGVQHYFLTKQEFDKLRESSKVIAYTKFPVTNYEYCVTLEQLTDDYTIYIINPDGLKDLKAFEDQLRLISVYISCNERILYQRGINRGDTVEELNKRIKGERDQFALFAAEQQYDYLLFNDGYLDSVFPKVDAIMENIKS